MNKTFYDVCLVVVSPSASLAEVTEAIGLQPADGSHSKGEAHLLKNRGDWKETVWKHCSDRGREASLEEHLRAVFGEVPADGVARCREGLGNLDVYVSVGVFSDAQIPTADVSPDCLALCAAFGAGLEVSFYTPDMS